MLKDPYIVTLKFKSSGFQIWFSATEENDNPDGNWNTALREVNALGDKCSSADEFFEKATKLIEKYGFTKETHNSAYF